MKIKHFKNVKNPRTTDGKLHYGVLEDQNITTLNIAIIRKKS